MGKNLRLNSWRKASLDIMYCRHVNQLPRMVLGLIKAWTIVDTAIKPFRFEHWNHLGNNFVILQHNTGAIMLGRGQSTI